MKKINRVIALVVFIYTLLFVVATIGMFSEVNFVNIFSHYYYRFNNVYIHFVVLVLTFIYYLRIQIKYETKETLLNIQLIIVSLLMFVITNLSLLFALIKKILDVFSNG